VVVGDMVKEFLSAFLILRENVRRKEVNKS